MAPRCRAGGLRGEQVGGLGGGERRKLPPREDCLSKRKKVMEEEVTSEELTKGLVFNFLEEVAPSLAQELEQSPGVAKNSLSLREVLEVTEPERLQLRLVDSELESVEEDLVKSLVLRYLRNEAPGLVKEFTERFDPGETRLELEEVLRGCQGKRKSTALGAVHNRGSRNSIK